MYATVESNLKFSVPRVLYDFDGRSVPTAAVTNVNASNSVDPVLTASEPSAEKPKSVPLTRVSGERISQLCASGELADHDCKVHWTPVLRESLEWLAIQHGGNWGMDHWMRWDTFKQPYWKGYVSALKNWRWTRWNDDDPFLDDYVGHPMMGAIISQIYIQNDPRSATLEFGKSKPYWKSRLVRSFWYSAAYSAQWKIGPASEASLEKVGASFTTTNSFTSIRTAQEWLTSWPRPSAAQCGLSRKTSSIGMQCGSWRTSAVIRFGSPQSLSLNLAARRRMSCGSARRGTATIAT